MVLDKWPHFSYAFYSFMHSILRRYISFLYFKTFKIQFLGVLLPLHYILVCKIHIYMPKMTLSSLLTLIFVLCIKFANLVYNTFCSQVAANLTPIQRVFST